jgi:hypothetical protein
VDSAATFGAVWLAAREDLSTNTDSVANFNVCDVLAYTNGLSNNFMPNTKRVLAGPWPDASGTWLEVHYIITFIMGLSYQLLVMVWTSELSGM